MKTFQGSIQAGITSCALDRVSFTLDEGKFVVIPGPLTYTVSILITFGVSLLVGWMISRKNRKIDMVEALKSAE
ncbi:MAG: hypothetical protein IJT70_06270 [Clostridia bacterium]|nr:hypothetical protein [Clostridia bacterium]